MPGLLVHEWIAKSGGSENVLEAMSRAFPGADIQCLWNDAPERFKGRQVRETWLAQTPLRRHKSLALPFTIPTWRGLRGSTGYDWLLASSHLFAHHARLRGQELPKYVYAHTPARYIWNPELDERGDSAAVKAVSPLFRRIDRVRAQEATAIAANSEFVRDRISAAWERDAEVIHPPVAVDRILAESDWRAQVTDDSEKHILESIPGQFVLGASRFVRYKRLDLVIRAADFAGLPVVIAGRGPEEDYLREVAASVKVPTQIIVSPSDELLYALMQRASVFLFPAVEDFGIVPVEAQAAGTPVVTGPVGGQTETFVPGVSGVIAASTEVEHLGKAIETALGLASFDHGAIVSRYSEQTFIEKIREFVR